MPKYVFDLLEDAMKVANISLVGLKVSMLGLSYKANVGDLRESPALIIRQLLLDAGVDLKVSDPYINDPELVSISDALKHADVVMVATGHKDFLSITPDIFKEYNVSTVVDGRNIYRNTLKSIRSLGIHFVGVGIY
jgi:UDP-N-acetyl-D-mannosaminuronate dehydrogenase